MLINFSNHPYSAWDKEQKRLARTRFDEVVDLSFPDVPPEADYSMLDEMVADQLARILSLSPFGHAMPVVHIMGELTFCFRMVIALKAIGICCIASTTKRDVVNVGSEKRSVFRFVDFREY